LAFAALAAVAVYADIRLRTRAIEDSTAKLNAVLDITASALEVWIREEGLVAEVTAESKVVDSVVRRLINLRHDRAALLANQQRLRNELGSLYRNQGYEGFFLIAPDLTNLVSSRDADVGVQNVLAAQPDFFERLRAGVATISRPLASDVSVRDASGKVTSGRSTMFVGAPVMDAQGKPIAFLTIRINPYAELHPILKRAWIGNTGESYIFDRDGRLLSESRFETQLREIGLLSKSARAELGMIVRNPGVDLTQNKPPTHGGSAWPLTRMARDAVQGNSGIDVTGYRDYRGRPVVGAWHWFESWGIGLAVEQDVRETYRLHNANRFALYGFATVTGLLIIGLAVFGRFGARKTEESRARLSSVLDTLIDGVVTINDRGIMQSVNPAVKRISGYTSAELIGNNVSMLMPEPYRSAHDGYISNYLKTGHAKIIGIGREVTGRRKDGSEFPMELGVGETRIGRERLFTGIIRDISDRKAVEARLEEERRLTQKTLDALDAEIAVLDEDGIILFVNDSWREFADANGATHARHMIGEDYIAISAAASGRYSEQATEIAAKLREILEGKREDFAIEYPCPSPSEARWFLLRAHGFSQDNRRRVLVSHVNITERRQYEERLAAERETAQRYLDIVGVMIMVVNADGTIEMVNRKGVEVLEYPEREIVGRKFFDNFVPQRHHAPYLTEFRSLVSGEAAPMEAYGMPVLNRSGRERMISWHVIPLRDSENHVYALLLSGEDVTEQREHEELLKELNKELALMARVAQETDNLVFVTDAEGRTVWANTAAARVTGYLEREFEGYRPDEALQGPETDREASRQITQAIRTGQSYKGEMLQYTKSDVPFWAEIEVTPVLDENLAVEQCIFVERDITQARNLTNELVAARDAAEAANRAKSSFLAAMSHEIRTPMNGVVGMIDVLSGGSLNDKQQELVETIKESAFSLLAIIDDILDFSKIEAGRLELEHIPVRIESIVENVGETLLPLAQGKGIELLLYCDPRIPVVQADPVRLRQILFNLTGNAVKFSGGNQDRNARVIVRVKVVASSRAQAQIVIEVEDNGIGIAPDLQAQLFRPFVQLESSTTRRFGGTGLGLTICRRLVDLMGGEIRVRSEPGRGSTFSVYLDLPVAEESAEARDTVLEHLGALLFMQDPEIGSFLAAYLEHAGVKVTRVDTDAELAARIQERAGGDEDWIAVVDSTGDRKAARLAQEQIIDNPGYAHAGLLLLMRGKRRHARKEGNNAVALDIDALRRKHLIDAVAAAAGRRSLEEMPEPAAPVPEQLAPSVAEAESAGRLILVAEDNKNNQKVLRHQLAVLGYTAEFTDNGQQALEQWRTGRHALILTDCHMPVMDGYDLARAIRREERGAEHVPIIAITADAMQGAEADCIDAGMDDYLSKPVLLHVLIEKLTTWLPSPEGAGESRLVDNEPGPEGGDDIVDSKVLREIMGTDDPDVLKEIYQDFLATAEETIAAMREAFAAGEHGQVGALAHKLKSSARTIGANALADCCFALEQAGRNDDPKEVDRNMAQLPAHFEGVQEWVRAHRVG
jgi:PAS domain S-box-containing protein